jgi:rubrerythrin
VNSALNFLSQLERENEALFIASEMQVEEFFKSSPSIQKMITHFEGRCVNECMNMLEVSKRLIEATEMGADRRFLKKLAKQVLDEADHFDRVAQVIEHLTGKTLDTAELVKRERNGGQAKGANLLTKYAEDDALALATYQFIAEGRAHRVWNKMADVIADPFISSSYRKIANDEKFHSEIGKESLDCK